MPIDRFPLVGTPTTREAESNTDQRFVNCFPEAYDKQHMFVVKRAGLIAAHEETSGAGRGITSFEGSLYWIIGNTIYKDGVALVSTLDSSTGRCYFAKRGGGTPVLLINDKTNLYTLNPSDTLTQISDVDYPATTVAGVEHLDQFVFVMDADGIIYNSDVNAPTSWDSLGFLTAEVLSDTGIRIIRHINYIMALCSESTELFYDAANTSGSPLSRLEGTVSLVGCSAGDTAVNIGQDVLWVATEQGGGNYVVKVQGLTPEPISTEPVEEALDAQGTNISNCWAYPIRVQGHSFYVLTLPDVGQTWVYDLTEKLWHQWTSYDGSTESYFTGIGSAVFNNQTYIQDEDNGKVYRIDADTYEDDGNTIKMRGVTEKYDAGTIRNKFMSRLNIVGDNATTSPSTLHLRYSDDDYQSFSPWRSIDMTKKMPTTTRLGRFQRRAFEYKFEENQPLRISQFEFFLRDGHHGR